MKNNEQKKSKVKGVMKGSCLWGILIFFILLFVDQATKLAADVYFNVEGAKEQIPVIPNWIYLTMSYNRGIAFGAAAESSMWLKIAIVAATALMMVGLALLYFKMDKRRGVLRTSFVMIVAGGVGNLIDRVYYQVWNPATATGVRDGVRDMVDLSRFGLAVCNFADFFIVLGAVLLLLGLIFFDRDAIFPVGKYKALAKEAEAADEAKKAEKAAQKEAKKAEKQAKKSSMTQETVEAKEETEVK